MKKNSELDKRINLINKRISLIKKVKSKNIKKLLKNIPLKGKRIRGLLVLLTAETNVKKITNYMVDIASAIEILHNATLIHDDIIDNADKRRGEISLNKKLGYELSVLSGDYLFSFSTLLLTKEKKWDIFKIFVNTAKDICEGEIEEVYNKYNTELSLKEYFNIISKKTGSLIKNSVLIGAYLGNIKNSSLTNLKKFGKCMGRAFQIKDDILDITGEVKKLGKQPGNDIKEGKITLPFLFALKNAPLNERTKITKIFKNNFNSNQKIKRIIDFIKKYNGIEEAEKEAQRYLNLAKQYLKKVKVRNNNKKYLLEELADYMVNRTN